jgi:(p)ppGpp synthase/HD superfamily hydrolase
MAAWLHDSVEDTPVTAEGLSFNHQVPDPVVVAVTLLTRIRGVSADAYYARIRDHDLAREVKLADLADNTDPHRLNTLDTVTSERLLIKYGTAYAALGIDPSDGKRRRGR